MTLRRRTPEPSKHERAALRLGSIGLGCVVLTLTLFGAWAASAPLVSTVVAEGIVKSDRSRRVVQHQEGGIVREILVRDGDHVKAGQVLVKLGDLAVAAEFRKVREQLDSELAKVSRLDAERTLAKRLIPPPELEVRRTEPTVVSAMAREKQVFSDHRRNLEGQLALLRRSTEEVDAEILALEAQVVASVDAARHMREELDTNVALVKEGFVQKTRIMSLRRSTADYDMRANEARAELAQARQRRVDLQLKSTSLTNAFVDAANGELKQTLDRVAQLRAQLEPTGDAAARQSISAPVPGRIVGLRVNTLGAVIQPRDVVLEIVPEDVPLVIEARLRTDAVSVVAKGSAASVRALAFDQRITPLLESHVTYLSPDRQTDPTTGAQFYVVHVEVADEATRATQVPMSPGMPVEVYFRAGNRTALGYLLDPLTYRMNRALRDK